MYFLADRETESRAEPCSFFISSGGKKVPPAMIRFQSSQQSRTRLLDIPGDDTACVLVPIAEVIGTGKFPPT